MSLCFYCNFLASTFWYRVVNTRNALPANIVFATFLAMIKARLNGFDLSKFAVLFLTGIFVLCVYFGFSYLSGLGQSSTVFQRRTFGVAGLSF